MLLSAWQFCFSLVLSVFKRSERTRFGQHHFSASSETAKRSLCDRVLYELLIRVAPQDPSFFNLQKIAEGTKHTLIQGRLAR